MAFKIREIQSFFMLGRSYFLKPYVLKYSIQKDLQKNEAKLSETLDRL